MKKVQLANTYNPDKKYKVPSWYASPKFDGVRAVFIPEQGFFTRNNKTIHGLTRMAEALEAECSKRKLTFVDGELIVGGGSFSDSQSAVMSAEHPAKEMIEFHIFAAGGDFSDTQSMLLQLPDSAVAKLFKVNSEQIPNTYEAVNEACRRYTAQGYEGVVLRHPEIPYHEGRSNHLLKYKYFKEADLKIVGTEAGNEADLRIIGAQEGEGRLAGTLGSLVVEGTIDGVKVRSSVGTGLTDKDRETLYAAGEGLIGKVLTVNYQSVTEKADKEGYFSLRFPSFAGIKQDR